MMTVSWFPFVPGKVTDRPSKIDRKRHDESLDGTRTLACSITIISLANFILFDGPSQRTLPDIWRLYYTCCILHRSFLRSEWESKWSTTRYRLSGPNSSPFSKPKAEQEPINFKPPHHYRYVLPILVPVTAWFAIANWIGWQFYLNAEVDEKLVACGSSSSGSTKQENAAEE